MKKQDHSYLDLSVLPQLRASVLSSDAVVLFNDDLSNILWANANGAKLFGGRGVVDLLNLDLGDQHALIKQLKKTIAQLNDEQSIIRGFRLNQGSSKVLLQFEITKITLPQGDVGYKITSHADENAPQKTEYALAREAIDSLKGFADAAAVIDDYGLPLAASREFEALGPSDTVLSEMITELLDEFDRLVKRPETSLSGNIVAVGLARLTEAPGRNLIVLADTNQQAQTDEDEANDQTLAAPIDEQSFALGSDIHTDTNIDSDTELADDTPRDDNLDHEDDVEQSLFAPNSSLEQDDFDYEEDGFGSEDISLFASPQEHASLSLDDSDIIDETDENELNTNEVFKAVTSFSTDEESDEVPSLEPSDEALSRHHEDQFIPSQGITPDEDAMVDVRFSWATDTKGIFTSVSQELETAVGEQCSSIVGKTWPEVASELGFDQDSEISLLLEAQETWSGKGVLWPVSNTDMLIPIDLAALPAFGTNRDFQGFRGFGVIRQLDAIVDPEAKGLNLSPSEPQIEETIFVDETNAPQSDDLKSDTAQSDTTQSDDLLSDDQSDDENGSNVIPMDSFSDTNDNIALNTQESSNFKIIGETLQGMDNFSAPEEDFAGEEQEEVQEDDDGYEDFPQAVEIETLEPEIEEEIYQVDTSLIANLPVAILIQRSEKLLHANKKFLEITGYENLESINNSGGLDILLDCIEAEDEHTPDTQVIITKSGDKYAINPVIQSVPWRGEKAMMLSFLLDQDLHLENDHSFELTNSQEIQNILDTASDGIIVMNEDGIIDSINASTEALLGWNNSETKGHNLSDFFAPESKDTVNQYIETVSSPGIDSLLNDGRDLIAIERNGGLIPIFLTITKMDSSNKYCAVVRDMTSWKKVEEELVTSRMDAEHASDQKTNFLAHVSHEIRTPLNAIIGFSDVMLKERFGPVDNDRYREYLQDIKRSGAHVLDLVNDLLDLSKIEAGKLDLSFEAVELNQLVSESVALLQPQANTNRIIIRTSLSRAVPKVVADTRSMCQIILNLVSNAIKFSSPNTQVIVSTLYEPNGEVALRVRDTGSGMSASEIEDALKPFHQLQNITERKHEGTGLGLPLTKALVEANRAHFDIESMPGQGTIVHVQFPIQRVLTD